MRPEELEEVVKAGLNDAGSAWRDMQLEAFAAACPTANLSLAEKALIYHYTQEGYRKINADLHASAGRRQSVLCLELMRALDKLPCYEAGLVYSAVHLSAQQLLDYRKNEKFRWPAFLSTTTSSTTAKDFLAYGAPGHEKNCLFLIIHATGRLIEELSCYGPNGQGRPIEYEVLFSPNREFVVDERRDKGTRSGVIEIKLREVTRVL